MWLKGNHTSETLTGVHEEKLFPCNPNETIDLEMVKASAINFTIDLDLITTRNQTQQNYLKIYYNRTQTCMTTDFIDDNF